MSMLLLAVLAVFVLLAFLLVAVLSQVEERATARASLRQLKGYEIEDVREREMLNPVSERVVAPVGQALVAAGRRLTPSGYVDAARHKLTVAGRPGNDNLDRFLATRVVTAALVPVVFLGFLAFGPMSPRINLAVGALLALFLAIGPDAVLNRQMEERQRAIRIQLPDILDLLTISVEAGLGFEQALDRTVTSVPGPLSDEFNRMLGEIRAGASRADALRSMDARTDVPEVRSFVLAILQADTFGVSIGRVLRAQADEMRIKRRQLAQEEAQKAPVKMLIPMVFCIFPALFVVVLGPAVINIQENLR
jgi:tight adherence protein C